MIFARSPKLPPKSKVILYTFHVRASTNKFSENAMWGQYVPIPIQAILYEIIVYISF